MPDTLIRLVLLTVPHVLHGILSIDHSKLKHLLQASCFSHHIAEIKYLFPRNTHVRLVIPCNHRNIQERIHVVALLQSNRLQMIRRRLKCFCPIFMHEILLLLHGISLNPGKHIWVGINSKGAVNIIVSSPYCLLRFDEPVSFLLVILRLCSSLPHT